MQTNFFKALIYALAIVTFSYWLPFAYTWFVLDAPPWLAAVLAFIVLVLVVDIERKRTH